MERFSKVLVADDDDDFRDMVRDYLTGEGYAVIEARDGCQAFDMTLSERPDVLLLDIMMPRRGGFDVCRDLKAAEPGRGEKCIVVMLTARAGLSDRLAGYLSGASRYICKPCDLTEIGECLEIVLNQRDNAAGKLDGFDSVIRS
jgi:DNA-binding response OmpR family regulator